MRDTIVVRPRRNPGAARTLVCLGVCGGGCGTYLPWAEVLPPEVELAAVCYPGRDGRFAEDFAQDWDELAEDAVAAVEFAAAESGAAESGAAESGAAESGAGRPYVLFGHSMGGWMAFDVAARIAERGGPVPAALVISSANAPSRGLTPQDMFPSQDDSDEELMDWMRTFGLLPGYILDDPDLRDMTIELMRADLTVRDSFYYRDGAMVTVPVQVFTGADDAVIDPGTAGLWRKLAGGPFRHDELPGGHFYTPEVWASLPTRFAALEGVMR